MFKSLDQKSVVEEVCDQMRTLILDGELKPGSRLPTEKELIQQLNIGRSTLREAVCRMVGEGLLVVRPGSGTYVREPKTESVIQANVLSLLLQSEPLEDIQEVRRILEPEIAALAAEKATAGELDEMDHFLDEAEKKVKEGDDIVELTWKIHYCLVRSTGNSAMVKIGDILYGMIQKYETLRKLEPSYGDNFDPMQEVKGHRDLISKIRTGDPDLARAAMKEHLKIS